MTALVVKVYPVAKTDVFWAASAAVATIVLALVTVFLARKTSQVATETKELAQRTGEDVAAQLRPALVSDAMGDDVVPVQVTADGLFDAPPSGALLTLRVRNSGRGPALNIRANSRHGGETLEGGAHVFHPGALPTGAVLAVVFRNPGRSSAEWLGDREIVIEMDYEGLSANRVYRSTFTIKRSHYKGSFGGPVVTAVNVQELD